MTTPLNCLALSIASLAGAQIAPSFIDPYDAAGAFIFGCIAAGFTWACDL
jgi:hypothetical protein